MPIEANHGLRQPASRLPQSKCPCHLVVKNASRSRNSASVSDMTSPGGISEVRSSVRFTMSASGKDFSLPVKVAPSLSSVPLDYASSPASRSKAS